MIITVTACGAESNAPAAPTPITPEVDPIAPPPADEDEEYDGPPVFVPPSDVLPTKPADVIRYWSDGIRHITMATWWDIFYDSSHQDIWDNPDVTNVETAQMSMDALRRAEQEHNVYFEWVNMTWDGIVENIRISIMSGVPDAEIYMVDTQWGIPLALSGFATSLEEMGLEGTDVFGENLVMESLKLPGQDETYLFRPSGFANNLYSLGYNKDMVAARGLEDPQDLWNRGEWTWDVWRHYIRELTDPTQDIYGYAGVFTVFSDMILWSNNAKIAGGPQQTLDSPEVMEVLQFIYDIYNVDRSARPWDPDVDFWDGNNSIYAEGRSAFWITAPWIHQDREVNFEFGIIPFPIGPSGDQATMATRGAEGNFFFIPRFIKNPREVYDAFYDYTNWFNFDTTFRDEAEHEWPRNVYETEENWDIFMQMQNRQGFDFFRFLGLDFNLTLLMTYTTHDAEHTPASFVETYKQVLQDALDWYFN